MFPEVRRNAAQCRSLIQSEEASFAGVYRQGMQRLGDFLGQVKKPAAGEVLQGLIQGNADAILAEQQVELLGERGC